MPDIFNDENIGQSIAAIRKNSNQSQFAFAPSLGLNHNQLANIESGRTPISARRAWDFCKKYDCHPQEMLNGLPGFKAGFPALADEENELVEHILNVCADRPFREFWAMIGWKIAKRESLDEKKELTYVTLRSNTDGVKSEVERLVSRLKHVTAKSGKKAELARFMNVAPPRVTEWLSGQEPGGENALRLLKWVELQERQQ
jgi:transcriptional regulator with XRE-family HTH domain